MNSLATEVLGVSSLDEADAIYTAYNHVTGAALPEQDFQVECERLDTYDVNKWDAIPPYEQEQLVTLRILRQIFHERQIKHANTLQYWPTYEAAHRMFAEPADASGNRWALQVGCLTAISAAGFAALSRDVYGARPLSIDLTGSSERACHGNYTVTNALELGIADNSIDVVQTNNLVNMFEPYRDLDTDAKIDRLFDELSRVLRPGGRMLLCERSPNLDFAEYPHFESEASQKRIAAFRERVCMNLVRTGFVSALIEPATQIQGVDYLFDPSRDFSKYEVVERAGVSMVSAQKSAV